MLVRMRELCSVVRSKQAGPYRLTFDLIFRSPAIYEAVKAASFPDPAMIARLFHIPEETVTKIVYYDPGFALKIAIVRPRVAGDPGDGDVYGCQQHAPLLDLALDLPPSLVVDQAAA